MCRPWSAQFYPHPSPLSNIPCLVTMAYGCTTFARRQDFSTGDRWRVAGSGWRVVGQAVKNKKIKIKRGNQKKKNNNKLYKKRYFSNIILHDIACTSNIYPATRQVRSHSLLDMFEQCLRQPRPQGFSF